MYAYILVEIMGGSPRGLEKKIANMKDVIESRSVYGSHYDVVVRAEAKDQDEFSRIVDAIQLLGKGIFTVTLQAKREEAINVRK